MSLPKHNAGVLTLRVVVRNFNADMTLDQLGSKLHDVLDENTLALIKENTKDEQWMYEIEAYAKPDGENRHAGIGHNIKNEENQDFIAPDWIHPKKEKSE